MGFISRKFESYVNSKEYQAVNSLKNSLEKYKEWAVEENGDYWKEQAESTQEKLKTAEPELAKLEQLKLPSLLHLLK